MNQFIICILELTKFYIIFRFGLDITERKNLLNVKLSHFNILPVILLTIVYVFAKLKFETLTETFILYPLWITISLLILFSYPLLKHLLIILITCGVISILDSFIVLCFYIITRYNSYVNGLPPIHNSHTIQQIYILGYCFSLAFIAFFIFSFCRHKKYELIGINIKYYLIMGFVVIINIWIVQILWSDLFQVFLLDEDIHYFVYVISGIFITTVMQLFFILRLAVSNNVYREKNELNQYYLKLQQEHFNYLYEKEYDTRKFRHDIKEHILVMKSMLKDNSINELSDYVEAIWGKIENISMDINMNNPIADAVFNQYMFLCKQCDIILSVNGTLPSECHISSFDLCTILSNLLQNAYEASSALDNGLITVTLRYDDEVICIHAENTFVSESINEVSEKDTLPSTTKPDKHNHGFGLSNIRECVNRYNGTIQIEKKPEENIFIIDILLFNRP